MTKATIYGLGLVAATAIAALGAAGVERDPRAALDRAQAAFEANDAPDQGRGYNWAKLRANPKWPDVECTDSRDKLARYCWVQLEAVDPKTGRSLGVSPEEFLCSPKSCSWIE